MVSPERLDGLQRQWVGLLDSFGVPPADAYPVFDRLVDAYSEPHRHYHTLEHVGEVLRVAGRLGASPAVRLAAWFHDAVYNPRAADNEGRSAELLREWLGPLGLPAALLDRAAELVRATDHRADTTPPDGETLALLDADLAILGAAEARYRRYAADVRREYAHVPDADYRRGRAAVLSRFLARQTIFLHPLMRAEGEAAARRNMRSELADLGA
jgi:predicted metal-dependent HD superfamily phosphohydrolase